MKNHRWICLCLFLNVHERLYFTQDWLAKNNLFQRLSCQRLFCSKTNSSKMKQKMDRRDISVWAQLTMYQFIGNTALLCQISSQLKHHILYYLQINSKLLKPVVRLPSKAIRPKFFLFNTYMLHVYNKKHTFKMPNIFGWWWWNKAIRIRNSWMSNNTNTQTHRDWEVKCQGDVWGRSGMLQVCVVMDGPTCWVSCGGPVVVGALKGL